MAPPGAGAPPRPECRSELGLGENGPVKIWEILSPRRLVTTALILLAGVIAVYGLQHVKDQRTATCGAGGSGASPVKVLYPCPGDDGLRQGRIGVSLAQGYTTDLIVDGITIPQYQLIVEGSDFFFIPGPDKVTGALAPGSHRSEIRYRKLTDDTTQTTSYVWAFTTH